MNNSAETVKSEVIDQGFLDLAMRKLAVKLESLAPTSPAGYRAVRDLRLHDRRRFNAPTKSRRSAGRLGETYARLRVRQGPLENGGWLVTRFPPGDIRTPALQLASLPILGDISGC